MTAKYIGQILRKSRARHHNVTTSFLRLYLEIALDMGDKANDGRGLFVFRSQFGNHGQRLDAVAVQIHHDERWLFVRIGIGRGLFSDFFLGLNELNFDVEFARNLLDLGQEEEIVYEGEDAGGCVHTLPERLHVGGGSCAVAEAITLGRGAILVAIAVVHGTNKSAALATLRASAILTVGAVLSTATTGTSVSLTARAILLALPLTLALLLALVLIVLRVSAAETAFTTPRLPRALALVLLRLVWSIIHSVIT